MAVFACGAHGPRPWSLLASPLAVLTSLVFIANDPLETFPSSWIWCLNLVWIYGLGTWIRQNNHLAQQARAESAALAAASAAEDRVRIARDVHDTLAHSLAVMIVQSECADEVMDTDPAGAHRAQHMWPTPDPLWLTSAA